MKRSDSSVALSILMDMPLSGISTRQSMSAFDYGDEKTVLKCVKRKGCDIFGGDYNNKFGLFLGLHEGVYVIGVLDPGSFYSKCFFLSCDFFAAFFDAFAHFLQGFASTSR